MKRQRIQAQQNGDFGYGYSSFGDGSLATAPGATDFTINPSGVNMQARTTRLQGASLSHGMQPHTQPNLQSGLAGMPGAQQATEIYTGLSTNMNGASVGNQFQESSLGTAGQLGQGFSMGTFPSMSQHMGQNMGSGQLLGQLSMSDIGPGMLQNIGSGMGQNMAPNMSMALNMGGVQLESQAGLNPALGQGMGMGMGISEGFPCVKLRGLPFDANEQDIAAWLVCCWDSF